jgi:hypothetical protein
MSQDSTVLTVFSRCVNAIREGKLIQRETLKDKEFHFQNWVQTRLEETNLHPPEIIPNPSAGREHVFYAWRLIGGSDEPVVMRQAITLNESDEAEDE